MIPFLISLHVVIFSSRASLVPRYTRAHQVIVKFHGFRTLQPTHVSAVLGKDANTHSFVTIVYSFSLSTAIGDSAKSGVSHAPRPRRKYHLWYIVGFLWSMLRDPQLTCQSSDRPVSVERSAMSEADEPAERNRRHHVEEDRLDGQDRVRSVHRLKFAFLVRGGVRSNETAGALALAAGF